MPTHGGGGRPPKPTNVKRLDGTRKDRVNEKEPEFAVVAQLVPPERLDAKAREHWLYYVEVFLRARTITVADLSLMDAASERWSTYLHTSAKLRRRMNRGDASTKLSQIVSQTLNQYLAIMREFGAGAASRGKIKVEKAAERDEFADLFDSPQEAAS